MLIIALARRLLTALWTACLCLLCQACVTLASSLILSTVREAPQLIRVPLKAALGTGRRLYDAADKRFQRLHMIYLLRYHRDCFTYINQAGGAVRHIFHPESAVQVTPIWPHPASAEVVELAAPIDLSLGAWLRRFALWFFDAETVGLHFLCIAFFGLWLRSAISTMFFLCSVSSMWIVACDPVEHQHVRRRGLFQ